MLRVGRDFMVFVLLMASVLLACVLPFGWYAVLSQHSNELAWFTYRDLAVSCFELFAVVVIAAFDVERPVDREVTDT